MVERAIPCINVLGTGIAAFNLDTAIEHIDGWLAKEERIGRYICVTGVHGVMESLRSPDVAKAHRSSTACVPDGMPMTWIGRLRGHRTMNRVYGPDLMLRLLDLSARRGYTNYFYGGAEGVANELRDRMVRRFPGLEVIGTYCPPFRPLNQSEREEVVNEVNRLRPDLVWVGLSTPKQELFMEEFHDLMNDKVMVGVGAAFDFHTGRVRQAPKWMMESGLEWLYRLLQEPRRLAPRYLRNNPAFVWHITLQQLRLRKYPRG